MRHFGSIHVLVILSYEIIRQYMLRKLALAYFQERQLSQHFYSLWFDPTGNRTRVYRFGSTRFIRSTTDRLLRKSKHHVPLTLWAALFYLG